MLAKAHWEKHITLCFMTLISTHNHLLWLSPTESVLLLLWKCFECQIYIHFLLEIVPNKCQTDHCICSKLLQVQPEKVGLMLNATNMHGKVLNMISWHHQSYHLNKEVSAVLSTYGGVIGRDVQQDFRSTPSAHISVAVPHASYQVCLRMGRKKTKTHVRHMDYITQLW